MTKVKPLVHSLKKKASLVCITFYVFVVTSNRRGIVTGSPGCLKSAPSEFLQTSPSVLWLVLLLVGFMGSRGSKAEQGPWARACSAWTPLSLLALQTVEEVFLL